MEACRPPNFCHGETRNERTWHSPLHKLGRPGVPCRKNQRRFTLRGLSGIFRSLLLRRFSFNQKRDSRVDPTRRQNIAAPVQAYFSPEPWEAVPPCRTIRFQTFPHWGGSFHPVLHRERRFCRLRRHRGEDYACCGHEALSTGRVPLSGRLPPTLPWPYFPVRSGSHLSLIHI